MQTFVLRFSVSGPPDSFVAQKYLKLPNFLVSRECTVPAHFYALCGGPVQRLTANSAFIAALDLERIQPCVTSFGCYYSWKRLVHQTLLLQ
jgi:hypothetical protein